MRATAQLAATTARRSRRRARRSPYVSPNSASAPSSRACGSGMKVADTGRSSRTARLATSSISLRVAGDRACPQREVEPEVAGLVVRAGLQRRRAEHLAQRGVHDVRARVRLARRDPPLGVDLGEHRRACTQRPRDDLDGVRDESLDRALHVDDLEVHAVGRDDALVGDLAAGLGVERRAVEHDLGPAVPARSAWTDSPSTTRPTTVAVGSSSSSYARKSVAPSARRSRYTSVFAWPDRLDLRVGLGALALLLHEPAEALAVDLEPLLGRHLQGQVDREAVGVVQLERLVAGQGRRPRTPWCAPRRCRGSSCPRRACAGTPPPRRTRSG